MVIGFDGAALKEAQDLKPTLKCGFVVSRKIGSTVLGRDTRVMAADAGIPIFDTEIEQRIAYAEALTMGKTTFEWSGGGPAIIDIQNLTHELSDVLIEQNIRTGPEAKAASAWADLDLRAQRGTTGHTKPETFNFLGFTHICVKKRSNGRYTVIIT